MQVMALIAYIQRASPGNGDWKPGRIEKARLVLLQSVALSNTSTPFRAGTRQFRAATRKQRPFFAAEYASTWLGHTGIPDGLQQPHEKNGPVLLQNVALGTWPRLKCTFYEQSLVLQNQPYFSRFMEGEAEFRAATRKERTPDGLEQPHEKNGPVLLQNVASTPLGTHEHSRVHFSILRLRTQFRAATRKERPCFAAECGFGRLGHTGTLEALEQPHAKNGPVLLQHVAPTRSGTHEHSRAHFSILTLRTPKQGVPKGLEQPHDKKGGHLEIGTLPRLKCTF